MVKVALATLMLLVIAATQPARGGELLLLDFTSPTCGPCQQMIPTVQGLEAAGYPVRRVDVTREPDLARRFGVDQFPTFVMLADGQETERLVGATGREQLEQMFQRAGGRVRAQSPDTAVPAADPWTGVGGAAAGVQDAPARSVTRTAPLSPQTPATDPLSNALISSSVRLRVDDSIGHSYGTGTIIDVRSGEALVITCGHLFRESNGKGPVMVEVFADTPDGVRVVGQFPGQVINYNLDRDIGLVSIRTKEPVRVAPVAPGNTIVERGDRVTSVGCNNGQDPTALATHVTNVNRYQGPPNIEAVGAPVEGRSGGGLFNSAGQLIGVCFAADYEGNEGLYTALDSIHDELDLLGLSEIYQASGNVVASAAPAQPQAAIATATATPPVVRGQEPLEPMMPLADEAGLASSEVTAIAPSDAAAAPSDLNPVEQAAWEEIVSRASDAEVICIIRPREPGGKSEVITLDRVSPEFVRALADRRATALGTLSR